MLNLLNPRNEHNVVRNLLTICCLLESKSYVGMLYGTIHWFRKIVALCAAVILVIETGRVNLKFWLATFKKCCLTLTVPSSGPIMQMVTDSRGPAA